MVVNMVKQVPEDVIESVRNANDIVDVVSEYVQLRKQGSNFFGLCPFHDEKTPSFSVTQDKQIFYCFGCKKGGNVLTFLMELEGYSFFESLSALAQRSGIDLPKTSFNRDESLSPDNQNALSAYDWLTKLYHHILRHTKEGKEGLDYLQSRGIHEETIDEYQLGFAPHVKDFTLEFLEKKGFHQQFLIKNGILTLQEDNNVTDRFRGRVIFPIKNHIGKTIAFSARALQGQEPKYLNSSESDLFQKGRILYNFDLAKRHIRKQSEVILFEGQMDVISAYQSGIKNVVATLGTAITESQAKLLNRYVNTVIICYDADHAGIEASYKAANLLRKIGCNVRIAHLTNNLDPDGFIKKFGPEAFEDQVIKASDTFIHFFMRYIKKDYNLSIESDRIQYIKNVLQEVAKVNSSVEQEYYLKEISSEYNLSLETLKEELYMMRKEHINHKDKSRQNRYNSKKPNFKQDKNLLPAFHNAERHLIGYMLQDRMIADRVQQEIGMHFNVDEHKIIAANLYAFYEKNPVANLSMFIEQVTDENIKQLIIEIAMIPIQSNISERQIDDYLTIIQRQRNDIPSIDSYREQQKIAEQQNDHIKAAQIAMQIIEIQKQLNQSK